LLVRRGREATVGAGVVEALRPGAQRYVHSPLTVFTYD
jgi:hypothetical protein